jgi:uncharacterized membrane protein
MTQLVAVAYPTEEDAQRAADILAQAKQEQEIVIEDIAMVTRDVEGELQVHQTRHVPGIAIGGSAAGGTLIGALLGGPIGAAIGAAVGATAGAISGNLQETGIDNDVMKDFAMELRPGSTGLFVLLPEGAVHNLTQILSPLGGTVLHTTLPTVEERRVADDIE